MSVIESTRDVLNFVNKHWFAVFVVVIVAAVIIAVSTSIDKDAISVVVGLVCAAFLVAE